MPDFTIAPAVRAALMQATERWPSRSRLADGTVGDLAHSSRTSDHNPDYRGVVLAFDLTHDPDAGCNAHAQVRAAVARRDRRIKYAISQGEIWSWKLQAQGWRPYFGSNLHIAHAHVSVARTFEDDTSLWWPISGAPKPARYSTVSLATQKAVHAPPDGVWGRQTDTCVNVVRYALNGGFPLGIGEAQRVVGAGIDGFWGPNSVNALRETVAELQRAWGTSADGAWGRATETAWRRARDAHFVG